MRRKSTSQSKTTSRAALSPCVCLAAFICFLDMLEIQVEYGLETSRTNKLGICFDCFQCCIIQLVISFVGTTWIPQIESEFCCSHLTRPREEASFFLVPTDETHSVNHKTKGTDAGIIPLIQILELNINRQTIEDTIFGKTRLFHGYLRLARNLYRIAHVLERRTGLVGWERYSLHSPEVNRSIF